VSVLRGGSIVRVSNLPRFTEFAATLCMRMLECARLHFLWNNERTFYIKVRSVVCLDESPHFHAKSIRFGSLYLLKESEQGGNGGQIMEKAHGHIFITEHLYKEYRHTAALRDVNITIPHGQIYGLIGENGAGKTTLLRILCGLTRPTRGRLLLFGAADTAG